MNKTTIWIIIILIIIVGGYYLFFNKPKQASGEPIKIGAILPLSGPVAIFGQWIKEGADLALEDINNSNITIIYEDSKLDPKEGISAFNKLTGVDGAKIIISAMSSVSVPIIPLAKNTGTLLLLQDVTFPSITKDNPLLFRHFIQSDREAELLANYAIDNLGIRTFGILYVNDEAGVGAKTSFQKVTEASGGQILGLESYGGRDTDMKTQVLKLKNQNPEAIYLFGNGPSWAQALKQIKELGFDGAVLTNTAMFIKNFRDLAAEAAEGVYFTYPYADIANKNTQEFIDLYKKKYGIEPAIEAYYAWDLIHVVVKALQNNKWQTDNIAQMLGAVKTFRGAFGTTIVKDRDFLTSIAVGKITNNQIELLFTWKPE